MIYNEEVIIVICCLAGIFVLSKILFESIATALTDIKNSIVKQFDSSLLNNAHGMTNLDITHRMFGELEFLPKLYNKGKAWYTEIKTNLWQNAITKSASNSKTNAKYFKNDNSNTFESSNLTLSLDLNIKHLLLTIVNKFFGGSKTLNLYSKYIGLIL